MEIDYMVVGGKAMHLHGFRHRKTTDKDIWTSNATLARMLTGDVSCLPEDIFKEASKDAFLHLESEYYVSLNTLYTIKLSHLGWDVFWQKHKRDALLMKRAGAVLKDELYTMLVNHWKEVHGYKDFLSLYKQKDEFFDNYVEVQYDHDYLHELVAHPDIPVYTRCLKEGEQVAIDKAKFDKLPFKDQLRMFREEIAVIALERWLLNPKCRGKITWVEAWQYSLRKTVTALTKNWATDFIVKNLEHFDKADYNDFEHTLKTLKGETIMTDATLKDGTEVTEQYLEELFDKYQTETGDGYPPCFVEFLDGCEEEFYKWSGWEFVKQEGGGEEGSEYCYSVFKYEGEYYKFEYSYYSYQGFDTDHITIKKVTPKEKVVTVFE